MRDRSISITKGIAIILMVLGHARCPEAVNNYLAMMRMPLFFFMSGYCFKEKYLEDSLPYMKRRVTGIYWPYLKWSLFFLMIHNLCFYANIYSDEYGFHGRTSILYTTSDYIQHAISIVTKMQGHERLLGGFWFLKSLFVGSLIFYVTRRVFRSPYISIPFLLALTVFLSFMNWKIPYFAIGARETLGALFLMVGHVYKTFNFKLHNNILFVVFAIAFVGFGSIYWQTTMTSFTYMNVVPYALTSIIGTLALFKLGICISKSTESLVFRFLDYVGRYTFNVLTWHFLSMKLVSLAIIYIYGLPIKQLSEFPVIEQYATQGWWIVYLIIGVGVPVGGTYLYHTLREKINHNICKQ
jgi:fucose 4-O-acetylase-like acetyltransferase